MKSKTFIENTYEQMKNANIVKSSEQFSTDYLGKSKSYFRAMKAQGLDANTAMLTRLANELNTRRTLFESVGVETLSFTTTNGERLRRMLQLNLLYGQQIGVQSTIMLLTTF